MSNTKMTIELGYGESAMIGESRITLVEKSGKRARIVVQAPATTKITHKVSLTSAQECAPKAQQGQENNHGQHAI